MVAWELFLAHHLGMVSNISTEMVVHVVTVFDGVEVGVGVSVDVALQHRRWLPILLQLVDPTLILRMWRRMRRMGLLIGMGSEVLADRVATFGTVGGCDAD